jgi:light-regulated signal transduction histidine kinase (bacteriophytochrome)
MVINTVIRDITERRRAEDHIRNLNVDLERRVAQRTIELTRTNQALQEFSWAVSHDLKEPLRTVLIFLQLFQANTPDLNAESQEYLGRVVTAARRIEQLLTGLQNFIYASDSNEGTEIVNVADVLAPLQEQFRDQLTACGGSLDVGPMPRVRAIRGLLDRTFQNLITNAIKYRGEEPLRIVVTAERSDRTWTFSVADNGIGIPAEYHDRIFGVFKRLHTDAEVPGTGIGLAICKVAAERMGGHIRVDSTVGGGATFSFSLPSQDLT